MSKDVTFSSCFLLVKKEDLDLNKMEKTVLNNSHKYVLFEDKTISFICVESDTPWLFFYFYISHEEQHLILEQIKFPMRDFYLIVDDEHMPYFRIIKIEDCKITYDFMSSGYSGTSKGELDPFLKYYTYYIENKKGEEFFMFAFLENLLGFNYWAMKSLNNYHITLDNWEGKYTIDLNNNFERNTCYTPMEDTSPFDVEEFNDDYPF